MSYQLNLAEQPSRGGNTRAVGDNVFLADLPDACKVYAFYYAGVMENEALESRLRKLGEITGRNLFVNLGKLDDPQYDKIQQRFGIKTFPVIVMTAVGPLASPPGEYVTAFSRLDSKRLLGDPDRAIACVQELFNLFLEGKVAEAMSRAKWTQRAEALKMLAAFFASALGSLRDFVAERDISISVVEGKFELKRSGE